MEIELKSLLEETLKEHGKIEFDLTYVNKGCIVEIEIGEKINEECGSIYNELSEWLGYDEFINYLIQHNVQHNFGGEIFLDNGEICFNLNLRGSWYEYDDTDRRQIYFEEEFITNDLNIKLSDIGMDIYDEENLNIQFYKLKDTPITSIELSFYEDKGQGIKLNEKQLETLINFLDHEINQAIPSWDIDFDCEINWEVECEEKCLNFNYWSSPIKLKLNEIVSK
jgi:hypothetical protein